MPLKIHKKNKKAIKISLKGLAPGGYTASLLYRALRLTRVQLPPPNSTSEAAAGLTSGLATNKEMGGVLPFNMSTGFNVVVFCFFFSRLFCFVLFLSAQSLLGEISPSWLKSTLGDSYRERRTLLISVMLIHGLTGAPGS